MRILVIEDDDMVRETVQMMLRQAGHEVLSAVNGADGAKVLDDRPVDLVVTDILMPEKEGVETIFEIRNRQPKVRIVAISGGGRVKNFDPLEIAESAGADVTLQKPFEKEELLAAIQDAMKSPVAPAAPTDRSGK